VWFDSLGAKSSCLLIEYNDLCILIDPGIAVMHPSYPAPREVKLKLRDEGYRRIREVLGKADIVVITHYHYDHYLHEQEDIALYKNKIILAKNPNKYINDSQRKRAEKFYSMLYRELGLRLEEVLLEPGEEEYPDIIEKLDEALSKDYGDYTSRRKQLLEQGRKWFTRRTEKWRTYKRIPEQSIGNTKIYFVDGKVFEYNTVRLKFTEPLFHGVEYSRVGWIISVIVEAGRRKIYYTSDVNGPIIEDYASMIIDENPDILILDGPPTYLLGYTLNQINLRRAVENATRILEETSKLELVLYDHHLVREPKFRERTINVWRTAEKHGVKLMTVAEYMDTKPLVLQYTK